MRDDGRIADLLATLGLMIADEQLRAIEESTGLQPSSAAALVTIGHAPGQPIYFLRRVLRRSHSAVVRQVGSLVDLGLVTKRGGDDGRAVQGRLGALTEREKRALTRALEKLLASAVPTEIDAYRMCRLCDTDACGEPCPVETAVS